MNQPDTKQLGRRQREALRLLQQVPECFIQNYLNTATNQQDFVLTDSFFNDLMQMDVNLFQSLVARKIVLKDSEVNPSLNIFIIVYFLNPVLEI